MRIITVLMACAAIFFTSCTPATFANVATKSAKELGVFKPIAIPINDRFGSIYGIGEVKYLQDTVFIQLHEALVRDSLESWAHKKLFKRRPKPQE